MAVKVEKQPVERNVIGLYTYEARKEDPFSLQVKEKGNCCTRNYLARDDNGPVAKGSMAGRHATRFIMGRNPFRIFFFFLLLVAEESSRAKYGCSKNT